MLIGAASSCQWGKVFPLAGFDRAVSLQHCKPSGARRGLLESKATGCCYQDLLAISQQKKKIDKPSQLNKILKYQFAFSSGALLHQYEF